MIPYVRYLKLPYEKCFHKLTLVIKYDIFVKKNKELDKKISKKILEMIYRKS